MKKKCDCGDDNCKREIKTKHGKFYVLNHFTCGKVKKTITDILKFTLCVLLILMVSFTSVDNGISKTNKTTTYEKDSNVVVVNVVNPVDKSVDIINKIITKLNNNHNINTIRKHRQYHIYEDRKSVV